ncbi:TPA: MFS transporter [Burkholderia cenocepacia]|uniref:MFS transporter n=1 Tax=Burkholderia cenocepacia TaxID=95486 RepID=UPI001B9AB5DA|nr:MFS transporter [Burkholderia cenocepacia]MBR8199794.1 MFS transporter [Burkholderia cenocepacia]HDV6326391.1 MFS transporter [Burkholderia cenocepacia]HDV6352835.1 MFS transporter [Burkholderia cenocepacia]
MQSTIALFSVRGYPSFFFGRIANSIAIWVDFTLIFSLLSFSYHASPGTLGLAAALYGLPGLLAGPFIGALADRKSPALIMLSSATARFLTSLGLALAPNETMFIAWVLVKGVSNLGTVPAEQIVIRRLLSDDQIVSTVTLTSVVDQCTKILSPLLGAGLALVLHSRGGFALTGMLAVFSMGCACGVARVVGWSNPDAKAERRFPDFTLVRHVLSERPVLASALGLMLTFSTILGLYDSIVVVLLRDHGLPSSSFGTIVSCTAAGAVSCAIVLKKVLTHVSVGKSMPIFLTGFSATVVAAGVLALALPTLNLGTLCLLWVVNGFCYGGGVMSYSITLQKNAPRDALGVISTSARSLQLTALVLGPIVGSWAAQHTGIESTFIGAGSIGLAVGTYAAFRHAYPRERSKRTDNENISPW